MGLYIRGMEMPKSCIFCELYEADLYWCRGAKKEVPYSPEDERAKFCSLVEIPPHGRLIDADELFKEMEHKGWFDNADRDEAEDLVLDAPTIIEAEEGET